MKHLVALALLAGNALAQPADPTPATWRTVSVQIAKQGVVMALPSVLVGDTCATMTSMTHGSPDLVTVAVCPVERDKLVVTWLVRERDQTESGGAVGASAHGARFPAGQARTYDVQVAVR
jgi:hypothetical protein